MSLFFVRFMFWFCIAVGATAFTFSVLAFITHDWLHGLFLIIPAALWFGYGPMWAEDIREEKRTRASRIRIAAEWDAAGEKEAKS